MSWIQKIFEYKGGLNGLKMIIGAALVVVAGQIEVLNDLIPLLPDYGDVLGTIVEYLKKGISVLEWILSLLGNGFLTVGFLDKVRKVFK